MFSEYLFFNGKKIVKFLRIRLRDDLHRRLIKLAKQRKIGVSQLLEEMLVFALDEVDAEARFSAMANMGAPGEGLDILDKLDSVHS